MVVCCIARHRILTLNHIQHRHCLENVSNANPNDCNVLPLFPSLVCAVMPHKKQKEDTILLFFKLASTIIHFLLTFFLLIKDRKIISYKHVELYAAFVFIFKYGKSKCQEELGRISK